MQSSKPTAIPVIFDFYKLIMLRGEMYFVLSSIDKVLLDQGEQTGPLSHMWSPNAFLWLQEKPPAILMNFTNIISQNQYGGRETHNIFNSKP